MLGVGKTITGTSVFYYTHLGKCVWTLRSAMVKECPLLWTAQMSIKELVKRDLSIKYCTLLLCSLTEPRVQETVGVKRAECVKWLTSSIADLLIPFSALVLQGTISTWRETNSPFLNPLFFSPSLTGVQISLKRTIGKVMQSNLITGHDTCSPCDISFIFWIGCHCRMLK